MKSCNTTAKQMETNQFHNTRSFNTHQLKKQDLKRKIWPLLYIEQMFIRLEPTPTPYTSILLHCLLSFPMSFLFLSLSIFLFFHFPSFLFSFLSLSSPTQELDLILKVLS